MDTAPTSLFGQTFDLSPASLEEDFDDFGNLSDGDSTEQIDSAAGPKRRIRRLPSTAEKRANHNAIERARRESLNGRFMELAQALPTMNVNKRPSKNAIVIKSLDFVKGAVAREQELRLENSRLRSELNELRAKLGMDLLEPSVLAPSAASGSPTNAPKPARKNSATSVVTALSVKTAPASVAKPVTPVPLTPVAIGAPAMVPQGSPAILTNAGPYLSQDSLTAGILGFVDPFAQSSASTAMASSVTAQINPASPQDSTTDSESSHVTTPPSFAHTFGPSPFFFGESVHAPSPTFETDFLAQCGIQSGFGSAINNLPNWNNPSMGIHFGANSGGFPLFA